MNELPCTQQGLKDFIRFSTKEIKYCESKIKKLMVMILECNEKLTIIEKGNKNGTQS